MAQLKEGQTSIRDSLSRETTSLAQDLNRQTDALRGSFEVQTKELKSDLDSQTRALKSDLDEQTKDLKKEFDSQTKEVVRQLSDLKFEMAKSSDSNARWMLATVLVIVGAVVAACTFFFRTIPDHASSAPVARAKRSGCWNPLASADRTRKSRVFKPAITVRILRKSNDLYGMATST